MRKLALVALFAAGLGQAAPSRSPPPPTESSLAGNPALVEEWADRLLAGMGARLKPYEQALYARVERAAREALGLERVDALREEGAGLSLADAVALAVADGPGSVPASTG